MAEESRVVRVVPRIFWVCTFVALICWAFFPGYVVGWDASIYNAAIASLRAGHDPYLDATNIQRAFHAQGPHAPGTVPPFSYVYSPLTLPLLRLVAWWPFWLTAALYWTVFVVLVFTAVWIGYWAAEGRRERRVFAFLAPAAVFFPGLLQHDTFFSGNVGPILYGLVLLMCMLGWKRGIWWPFYIVVVLASCVKAPLLVFVAIAPLTSRGQWIKTGIATLTAIALFAVQPLLWPSLFHNYLIAVDLQFLFNSDFTASPAGLVAQALYDVAPYKIVSAVCYLAYAIPFCIILMRLRRDYLGGRISLRQWVPVLLTGAILLNPRIMEYDVLGITLMMALIVWRFFDWVGKRSLRTAIAGAATVFALGNTLIAWTDDLHRYQRWKVTEGFLVVIVFLAGCWTLAQKAKHSARELSYK
jgi:hypothetical protein